MIGLCFDSYILLSSTLSNFYSWGQEYEIWPQSSTQIALFSKRSNVSRLKSKTNSGIADDLPNYDSSIVRPPSLRNNLAMHCEILLKFDRLHDGAVFNVYLLIPVVRDVCIITESVLYCRDASGRRRRRNDSFNSCKENYHNQGGQFNRRWLYTIWRRRCGLLPLLLFLFLWNYYDHHQKYPHHFLSKPILSLARSFLSFGCAWA